MKESRRVKRVTRLNSRLQQRDIMCWLKRRDTKEGIGQRELSPEPTKLPLSPQMKKIETFHGKPKRSQLTSKEIRAFTGEKLKLCNFKNPKRANQEFSSANRHKNNKVVDLKTYLDTTRKKIFLGIVDVSKIKECFSPREKQEQKILSSKIIRLHSNITHKLNKRSMTKSRAMDWPDNSSKESLVISDTSGTVSNSRNPKLFSIMSQVDKVANFDTLSPPKEGGQRLKGRKRGKSRNITCTNLTVHTTLKSRKTRFKSPDQFAHSPLNLLIKDEETKICLPRKFGKN